MANALKKEDETQNVSSLKPHRELDSVEQGMADRQISRTNAKLAMQDKIEKLKEMDSIPTTGKFMNLRAPGQPVKLPYIKHNTDPEKWWNFKHGEVYTIPRGFVEQINDYYADIVDMPSSDSGQALSGEKKRTPIYAFVPINW